MLLLGLPGTGKTMLARRLPTILPLLDRAEALIEHRMAVRAARASKYRLREPRESATLLEDWHRQACAAGESRDHLAELGEKS